MIPPARVQTCGDSPIRAGGAYVLLWMTAQRRTRYNFALERAVALCNQLKRPLLVLEALRVDYHWASVRLHQFVLEGMRDNRSRFEAAGAAYFPYVEPHAGAGKGLLAALAEQACVVVTDTYPCFFLRGLPQKVAGRLPVRVESVDSCGLVPLVATDRAYPTAHAFRRFLQTALCDHLHHLPVAEPLAALRHWTGAAIPSAIQKRWPAISVEAMLAEGLATLPIDQAVGPAVFSGGQVAALACVDRFVEQRLTRYTERNHPDEEVASGLSPYLHFGHVSPAEVFARVAEREGWTPDELTPSRGGARSGWWHMNEGAESFLDELVTWRELGFNMCFHRDDYDQFASLPEWAQRTMAEHAEDERPELYTLEQLTRAETGDAIWNAAQRQLVEEGRLHNYLRMLWGKKIYQWSPTPIDALERMIELNNRYAVDGRDPNSYSGIFWVLGRYDRAWGPERPIFGKLRYMTSENTKKKLKMTAYLRRFGP